MSELRLAIMAITASCSLIVGCRAEPGSSGEETSPVASSSVSIEDSTAFARLDPPSGPGSLAPSLWVGSRGVLLVWIEPRDEGHRLMISRLEDEVWSDPVEVASGDSFFANWADTPAVVEASDGTLYAHWLEKLGQDTYAYGIKLTMSQDGGTGWESVGFLHQDRSEVEHGFVSMVAGNEGVVAAWLDGRAMADGGPMQLRAARITGSDISTETVLVDSVCECCSTAMAVAEEGPVVAFRSRTGGEIRDIGLVRHAQGEWQAPTIVHADGWEIPGCPVNGPGVAANGAAVATAWFTAAGDSAKVQVAFSRDSGRSFAPPILLDDANPLGRIGVVAVGEEAFVSWMASGSTEKAAEIRLQHVGPGGPIGDAVIIAETSPSRSAGIPRLVRDKDRLLVAWVEANPDELSALHVSVVPLPG